MAQVMGLDLVISYLVIWGSRKARRVGKQLDQDVDEVIDGALDRLHDLITTKLGDDPAIRKLELEAATGEISERTERRVLDALADATESDNQFGGELEVLAGELARLIPLGAAFAGGDRSAAVVGNVEIHSAGGSAAALTMGDVRVGAPPDPTGPGRSGG